MNNLKIERSIFFFIDCVRLNVCLFDFVWSFFICFFIFFLESKIGSTLPNKDDTGYSESGHAISNSQMQGNANDVSACPSIEISRSNSQLLEHGNAHRVISSFF